MPTRAPSQPTLSPQSQGCPAREQMAEASPVPGPGRAVLASGQWSTELFPAYAAQVQGLPCCSAFK